MPSLRAQSRMGFRQAVSSPGDHTCLVAQQQSGAGQVMPALHSSTPTIQSGWCACTAGRECMAGGSLAVQCLAPCKGECSTGRVLNAYRLLELTETVGEGQPATRDGSVDGCEAVEEGSGAQHVAPHDCHLGAGRGGRRETTQRGGRGRVWREIMDTSALRE